MTIKKEKFKKIKKIFKKGIAFQKKVWYNIKAVKWRPVGQAVKTLASHAGNMGSIPVRVTTKRKGTAIAVPFLFVCSLLRYEKPASCQQVSRFCSAGATCPSQSECDARISISRTGHQQQRRSTNVLLLCCCRVVSVWDPFNLPASLSLLFSWGRLQPRRKAGAIPVR